MYRRSEGFSAGSGMRRGSSPIPASQQGWNLADILTRCSGLLQGESLRQGSNPVVKLVLENYPFSCVLDLFICSSGFVLVALALLHLTFLHWLPTLRQSCCSRCCPCQHHCELPKGPWLHQLLWNAAIWHLGHFYIPNWKVRLMHSCSSCQSKKHAKATCM